MKHQILSLYLFSFFSVINSKLLFVFEHMRHGARGPWQAVNMTTMTDDFGEKWDGKGELTPSGLRMHYLLGVHNRKKYKGFYSENYNPNEVLVYSSNINRTIASVYSNLQGMFPNSSGVILTDEQLKKATIPTHEHSEYIKEEIKKLGNEALPNQLNLFPVHIFDPYAKRFLLSDQAICPGVVKLKEENLKTQKVKNIINELATKMNDTFGEILFQYFNWKDPNYLFNRANIYKIADVFVSDYFDKRKMEKLANTGINMTALYKLSLNISFMDTYEIELNDKNSIIPMMGSSPVFRDLLGWIDKRIELDRNGNPDKVVAGKPKFVIYSGHDTTLALSSFFLKKIFNLPLIPSEFASHQVFEVTKEEKSQKYFIEFFYNDVSYYKEEYEIFKKIVEKNLWSEEKINDFCNPKKTNAFMVLTFILVGVSFILITVLTFLVWFKK